MTNDLQSRIDWELDKAHRCDVRARLARRQGNGAMCALWEIYARQYRHTAAQLQGYLAEVIA